MVSEPVLQEEPVGVSIISLVKEIGEIKRLVIVADVKAEERWTAYHRALTLQALEIERRLEHLNGEAARITKERTLLTDQIRREMETGFLAAGRDTTNVRETLLAFMSEQRGINKGLSLSWTIFVAVITLLIAGFGLWVATK